MIFTRGIRLRMFRNPHPWRIMAAVTVAALLYSFMLQKLFSRFGNFLLAHVAK